MPRSAKCWAAMFIVMAFFTLAGPFFAAQWGDGLKSEAMAFSSGGPLGIGYDYLGRPLAPQLFQGGAELLLSSLLTAVLSRLLGLGLGIYLARHQQGARILKFFLHVFLVLPMTVVSLASYQAFHGSVYAIVPAACALSLPFSSRYYAELVRPVFHSDYFTYASLRSVSFGRLVREEVLPVLSKNVLTDISQAFITAIYMLSSVSFLGNLSVQGKFLWPQMLASNRSGFSLNPWGTLAPLIAILLLTVPLGSFVDTLERRRG